MIELDQEGFSSFMGMLAEELLITLGQIKSESEVKYTQFHDKLTILSNTPVAVFFSNDILKEVLEENRQAEESKFLFLIPFEDHLYSLHQRLMVRLMFNKKGESKPIEIFQELKNAVIDIVVIKTVEPAKFMEIDAKFNALHNACVSYMNPPKEIGKLLDCFPWLVTVFLILSLSVWEEVSLSLKGNNDAK